MRKLYVFFAVLLIGVVSIQGIFIPKSQALLEPTRLIDPHTVTAENQLATSSYLWDITPKTTIPSISGTGEIAGAVPLDSGSIGFSLRSNSIVFELINRMHTGSYAGGDYQDVHQDATTGGSDELSTITYPVTITPSTSYKIKIDISDSDWFEVSLQIGGGGDTVIGKFKRYADISETAGSPKADGLYTHIQAFDTSSTSCSSLTDTVEADVKIAIDGSNVDLVAAPALFTRCGAALDETSYNSSTKTATLKQLSASTPGVKLPHTISLGELPYLTTTNLDSVANGDGYTFVNLFSPNSSSEAVVYLHKSISGDDDKDTVTIAGGVFDLSSDDIDFEDKGVVLDSSNEDHKSVAHNLNTVTKDGKFTLFVPYRDGDKAVGICPGAETLADVSGDCENIVYLSEGSSHSINNSEVSASLVTVKGVQYWRVDGLTGSGAFSAALPGVPNTGYRLNLVNPQVILCATLLMAIAALIITKPGITRQITSSIKGKFHILLAVAYTGSFLLGVQQVQSPETVEAWRMPPYNTLLMACVENGMLHGRISKQPYRQDVQFFYLKLNNGASKSVYVYGESSVYLDLPIGTATAFDIATDNKGGGSPISEAFVCLP